MWAGFSSRGGGTYGFATGGVATVRVEISAEFSSRR